MGRELGNRLDIRGSPWVFYVIFLELRDVLVGSGFRIYGEYWATWYRGHPLNRNGRFWPVLVRNILGYKVYLHKIKYNEMEVPIC